MNMKPYYLDITSRIEEDPKWYDMNGAPRYSDISPSNCSNVYAQEVAFIKIECAVCKRIFIVEVYSLGYDSIGLSDLVSSGEISYGDPPAHSCYYQDCSSGDVQSSNTVGIVGLWVKDKQRRWKGVDIT